MGLTKKIIFSFVFAIVIFVGSSFTIGVIRPDFSIYKVKLIFDDPTIRDGAGAHQMDARYLPYTLRKVVFNKSVLLFRIVRNIGVFWNLNNFNNTILLANLYPVITGFWFLVQKKKAWWFWLSGLAGGSLAIGINKMVDARSATYVILPIFAYLFYVGIKHVNLKIYLPLLLLSILFIL